MEADKTFSISKLIDEYGTFIIPEYQRGYRWTGEEIRLLLEDIHEWMGEHGNSNPDSFYFLQNLIIKKTEEGYVVVDGQQRLTTISIILSYLRCRLDDAMIPLLNIDYRVRETSGEYLRLLNNKDKFKEFFSTPKGKGSLDTVYLANAVKEIDSWFSDRSLEETEKLKSIILDDVHLGTELIESEEERVFAAFNNMKIELDAADLIRAVVMSSSMKRSNLEQDQLNEYRIRIGMQLDEAAAWWNRRDVYSFFSKLLPGMKIRGFDTDHYKIDFLYIFFCIKENKEISLNYFQKSHSKKDILYEILQFNRELMEWFENIEMYHLIALLSCVFNWKFKKIHDIWQGASKDEFVQKLKAALRTEFGKLYNSDESIGYGMFISNIKDDKHDWYFDDGVYPLLMLMDVITAGNKTRLGLRHFQHSMEDKEHIACQHPQEEAFREFIVNILEEEVIKKNPDVASKLKEILELPDIEENREKVYKLIGEVGLGAIGNIVLLHQKVNRGYQNDNLPEKTYEILRMYFSNNRNDSDIFIRLHTFKMFMRGYCPKSEGKNTLHQKDIQEASEAIACEVERFFEGEMK